MAKGASGQKERSLSTFLVERYRPGVSTAAFQAAVSRGRRSAGEMRRGGGASATCARRSCRPRRPSSASSRPPRRRTSPSSTSGRRSPSTGSSRRSRSSRTARRPVKPVTDYADAVALSEPVSELGPAEKQAGQERAAPNVATTVQYFALNGVPIVQVDGSAITAESFSPPSGAIDPGETVTVDLTLTNVGAGATSNLVATLQPTGGVLDPSGPQPYGVIAASGGTGTKPFTFQADPSLGCGGTLVATLNLQDGASDLGNVSFSFGLGTPRTDILAAGGSFVSGGYTATLSTGFSNPLPGRQAWSGDSNGYITTTVNLPASAAGANVQLRWRFGSDSAVAGTGWRVDSITLTDGSLCAANAAPLVSLNPASQSVQCSDPIVPVTITAIDTALDTPLSISTQWKPDGGSFTAGLPSNLTLTDGGCTTSGNDVTCTWTLAGNAHLAPGTSR